MPILKLSEHLDHVHPEWGVEQIGWVGQSGEVYALYDKEGVRSEPGSFMPLYIARDEACGHLLQPDEDMLVDEAIESGERARIDKDDSDRVGSMRDL